ncbi:hypothetical protein BpHYR1_005261 [Brachionus plicatilis]|uniref:Uncharacterized protein n=1 Tax=Brachionus plicatilis TaxID=10195 RepID=A0A3M7RN31_BRAPC|nr:hypothetical protein BpHYR1_005261 [Brachionus plicatilis]
MIEEIMSAKKFMLKLQQNSDIWQIYCIRQPKNLDFFLGLLNNSGYNYARTPRPAMSAMQSGRRGFGSYLSLKNLFLFAFFFHKFNKINGLSNLTMFTHFLTSDESNLKMQLKME